MKQVVTRPNIFKLSTKELSQDAFIAWLLQWASPKFKELDKVLHECGKAFLFLIMGYNPEKSVENIEVGRQWDYVDVWAEIFFTDNTKTLLVIEDKTFTGEHSNQLSRYKKQVQDYCIENGFDLVCTYFKIGSEPVKAINLIKEQGFHIVTRKEIIECLHPYHNAEHTILRDFIEYVNDLQAAHTAFEILPPKEWHNLAWVGFYQFIESNIKIVNWHWVHNPNGGFWNCCLTWDYWNRHIPVYLQIEQHRLCYKIALGEDETDLNNKETDINAIQNFVHNMLMRYAKANGNEIIKRPAQFVHRGNYRTLAQINLEDWCGDPQIVADRRQILSKLSIIISFYEQFMDELNKVSFDKAEIKISMLANEQSLNES